MESTCRIQSRKAIFRSLKAVCEDSKTQAAVTISFTYSFHSFQRRRTSRNEVFNEDNLLLSIAILADSFNLVAQPMIL